MELMDTLELISFSLEYLSSHYCVDWLKAHEAHFFRERTLETTDLTGILRVSTFDPVNYRPLKELRPKHRTGIARIKEAIPAQLRAVEELLDSRSMGLHDTAYSGPKLAEDPRYGEEYGKSQLAQALATYGRSDPGAAKVVIVARSDFAGTSDQLFSPGTLVYLMKVAELNQILTLAVAVILEAPCEPELLLFAEMNDHLHTAGLLEPLKSGRIGKDLEKIWEAIQTLFASMNEIQELVAVRLEFKTRVVFTSASGYASMPPALQLVYAVLVCELRMLMAATKNFRKTPKKRKTERLAAVWADVSHAVRGFNQLADIFVMLDEVLCLEISNIARQIKFKPDNGRSSCDQPLDREFLFPEYGGYN